MTFLEAKTIALLACKFGVPHAELYRTVRMLWGTDRVLELVGRQKHDRQAGKDLEEAAEEVLTVRPGELRKLVFAECSCTNCGHTEVYITTRRDIGKKCVDCGGMNTMFMNQLPSDAVGN